MVTVALILLCALLAAIALELAMTLRDRTRELADVEEHLARLLAMLRRLRETERVGVVDSCERTRGGAR